MGIGGVGVERIAVIADIARDRVVEVSKQSKSTQFHLILKSTF